MHVIVSLWIVVPMAKPHSIYCMKYLTCSLVTRSFKTVSGLHFRLSSGRSQIHALDGSYERPSQNLYKLPLYSARMR